MPTKQKLLVVLVEVAAILTNVSQKYE